MAKVEWVNVFKPKEGDIKILGKRFGIHPLILDELRGPSARAHAEVFKDYIYFVYYFPIYDEAEQTSRRTEIDFIITKKAVITVHYERLEPLQEFRYGVTSNPLRLAYDLIIALMRFEERQLRHIAEDTEAIGQSIFKDREKEVLKKISHLKRDVSEYRIIVKHQGPILQSLINKGVRFGSDLDKPYLEDLFGEYLKLVNRLDDYRETITDFEDTNNQLMNLKINEVMKTFTTLSFLTFPFMLLAAIFSMNTKDTPIVNRPGSFWIILSAMGIAMVSLIAYFRKKGWL